MLLVMFVTKLINKRALP